MLRWKTNPNGTLTAFDKFCNATFTITHIKTATAGFDHFDLRVEMPAAPNEDSVMVGPYNEVFEFKTAAAAKGFVTRNFR